MSSLRQQVVELQSERERSRTTSPPGTEDLAQGDDEITLDFHVSHQPEGTDYRSRKTLRGTVGVPVDALFGAVGPAMFDECDETEMEGRFNRVARSYAVSLDSWPKGSNTDFSLYREDLDVIRTQLVALRLIEKSDKRHGVNDKSTYWKLTPYGETHLMTLLALRRQESANDQADDR